jgi:hypothetical protein
MKIAILGWGSLIWDKRDLPIVGDWQMHGPVLSIEFSYISSDGRLTLVIDEKNGTAVTTQFARSACDNLNDAVASLRKREKTTKERIGFVNLMSNTERDWSRQHHPTACDRIKAWARTHNWEAVVWTALTSNFRRSLENHFPQTPPSDTSTAWLAKRGIVPWSMSKKARKKLIPPSAGSLSPPPIPDDRGLQLAHTLRQIAVREPAGCPKARDCRLIETQGARS